ncbi:UNVERIFIED_CONTAM: hypothetical protein K2H54_048751 [Gekko kuhli]
MSTGPGCHATADVTIEPATEVRHAGPPGPNAKTDTRPEVPAMEDQDQAAAQKLLRRPPPELRHPLALPGCSGPKVFICEPGISFLSRLMWLAPDIYPGDQVWLLTLPANSIWLLLANFDPSGDRHCSIA